MHNDHFCVISVRFDCIRLRLFARARAAGVIMCTQCAQAVPHSKIAQTMNVEGGARSLSDEESWLHDDAPGSHERQPHGQLSESVSPGVAMSPGVETSFDFLAALDRGATQRKKAPQSPAEKHTRMRKAAASGGKKASVAANNRKVPAVCAQM